MNEDAYLS